MDTLAPVAVAKPAVGETDCREDAMKENPAPAYSVAEFFAGIGLVRLALEQARFRVVFANDIDPDKHEIYAANFSDAHFSLGDIHALDVDEIPTVDLATASFPCNDLSIAGAMRGLAGQNSGAFWGFVRVLSDLATRRPRSVLLENVPGFLQSHAGDDLHAAILALNDLGYACDAFLIDARRFVPQSRLRLFIVGLRDAPRTTTFGLQPTVHRPESLIRFIHNHCELDWNPCRLPPLPQSTAPFAAIVEDLPPDDPAWWDAERSQYFMNQLSERHAAVAQKMIDGEAISYATAFRRVRHGRSMAELRTDGVAGCLRTPRGGSGRQILFQAGCGEYRVRLLSPRECARLQGVPDTFRIDVPINQALFGFGDAVCVPVIRWIAEHALLPALDHRTQKALDLTTVK